MRVNIEEKLRYLFLFLERYHLKLKTQLIIFNCVQCELDEIFSAFIRTSKSLLHQFIIRLDFFFSR